MVLSVARARFLRSDMFSHVRLTIGRPSSIPESIMLIFLSNTPGLHGLFRVSASRFAAVVILS